MSESDINIIIKTINNENHNIMINSSSSISSLKSLIRNSTSIEEERQRLIYRGRVLSDESELKDYNIENGHTIHMVARPENFRELQNNANQNTTSTATSTNSTNTNPVNGVADISGILNSLLSRTLPVGTNIASAPTNTNQSSNDRSLEHIRQGLLTLNTLRSTMPQVITEQISEDVGANLKENEPLVTANNDTSHCKSDYQSDTNSLEDELVNKCTENDTTGMAEHNFLDRKFYIGQWVDVKDTVSQWLEATVMRIDDVEQKAFIHYNGW